jgi:transposase
MRFLEEQLEELDRDIIKKIRATGLVKEWQLLQTVPGIQERSATKILAETGPDMTQFPLEREISSWAGVCPGNNRSAGKNKAAERRG